MAVSWGIVGTGGIAAQLLPDFRAVDGSDVIAVSSRTAEGAERFAAEHSVERSHSSLESMLADPDVDALYIATPHVDHHSIAIRGLAAGKHVLIEKPGAISVEQVREIAVESRRSNRFAMEGMWMKFSPMYRGLLATLESGAIGDPVSVRASFGLPMPNDGGSRWSPEREGSTILDQGIYTVALALGVLGDPVAIDTRGQVQPDGIDVRMHAEVEFADGRWAQLSASMLEFTEPSASVSGTEGWIHLPFPFWGGDRFEMHTPRPDAPWGGSVEEYPRRGNGYVPMIEAVVASIDAGQIEHPWHDWAATESIHSVLATMRAQLGAGSASRPRPARD